MKLSVIALISIVFALLRKYVPAPPSRFKTWTYDQRQVPEPLPPGVVGAFMWVIGICLVLTFFAFKIANHAWADMDGRSVFHLYPTSYLWCFFPFFAALIVPWPLTVWLLRRSGRTDEADAVMEDSDQKAQYNTVLVMKWFGIGLVMPIAFFTLLAIPIHLSIGDEEARLGHYGSWKEEVFPFKDARRAIIVDGVRNRDGGFHRQRDLLIDFQDGRRLRANAVGDGGTDADQKAVELLLAKTGLQPQHAITADEIPRL
jgi:hypothetical protein